MANVACRVPMSELGSGWRRRRGGTHRANKVSPLKFPYSGICFLGFGRGGGGGRCCHFLAGASRLCWVVVVVMVVVVIIIIIITLSSSPSSYLITLIHSHNSHPTHHLHPLPPIVTHFKARQRVPSLPFKYEVSLERKRDKLI